MATALHRFYFYAVTGAEPRDPDNKTRFTEADLEVVAEQELPRGDLDDEKYRDSLLDAYNAHLRPYLKRKGIRHFIPYTRPSFDAKNGVTSVCYYHCSQIHDKVYGSLDQGYVLQPDAVAEARLDYFYAQHRLDEGWYDPRANTLLDPEAAE